MNRYRVLLPLQVQTADASYGQGDEFEHEFTAEEETANVASGLLEIVPRTYKVVGGSYVYETAPGEEFDAAIPIGNEALLIEGGHIERVDKPATGKGKRGTKKEEANT